MRQLHDDQRDTGYRAPRSARRSRPGGRRRVSTRQKVAAWLSVAVVTILVVAVLGIYLQYRADWDSIKRVDVLKVLGNTKQPPKLTNAENILLIGSDTRTDQNGVGGWEPGCNCSDTLMVLHISPGHHQVTVMSIPRDTIVPQYACPAFDGLPGQHANPYSFQQINEALEIGGAPCTWTVVEQVTGIHIDHFLQLDFTGFENVINDLGGVQVCLPTPISDPAADLNLPAGTQTINGANALAVWREREDAGDGSDLERIQRDQYLMAAIVQGIVHSGLQKNPAKILKVVKDVAASLRTDTGLDQNAIVQIAESLPSLNSQDVTFITAPNSPDPDNINKVVLAQPQARELFAAIQDDVQAPSSSPSASASAPPAVAASQVKVEVENGSGVTGIASQVATDLTSQGFDVVGTGDAGSFGYTSSVIEYAGSADQAEVNTLKAQLPGAATQQNSSLAPGTLVLIVGSSFTGLSPTPTSSTPPSITSVAQGDKDQTLNASTPICQDAPLFARN